MKRGRLQCKDVPADVFVAAVEIVRRVYDLRRGVTWHAGAPVKRWAMRWDVEHALNGHPDRIDVHTGWVPCSNTCQRRHVPWKVVVRKAGKLMRAGVLDDCGCACGCRGDFVVADGVEVPDIVDRIMEGLGE